MVVGVKAIIEKSRLSAAEKSEIYQNLGQIPLIIEQVRADQTRSLSHANGDEDTRPKQEKKPRRSSDSATGALA
jgi:hypothetical protein